MCIIAVTPPNTYLTDEEIDNCWKINGDGAGFAYVAGDGKIKIRKGFMNKDEFVKALRSVQAKYGKSSAFVVHFRIRTHGLTDAERTHPFRLPDGSALAHNGVLAGSKFYDPVKSDTQLFIERFGGLLTKEILAKEKEVIGNAIGYNKFAILHKDGDFTIVNDRLGQWDKGRWFSNASFRSMPSVSYGCSHYRD